MAQQDFERLLKIETATDNDIDDFQLALDTCEDIYYTDTANRSWLNFALDYNADIQMIRMLVDKLKTNQTAYLALLQTGRYSYQHPSTPIDQALMRRNQEMLATIINAIKDPKAKQIILLHYFHTTRDSQHVLMLLELADDETKPKWLEKNDKNVYHFEHEDDTDYKRFVDLLFADKFQRFNYLKSHPKSRLLAYFVYSHLSEGIYLLFAGLTPDERFEILSTKVSDAFVNVLDYFLNNHYDVRTKVCAEVMTALLHNLSSKHIHTLLSAKNNGVDQCIVFNRYCFHFNSWGKGHTLHVILSSLDSEDMVKLISTPEYRGRTAIHQIISLDKPYDAMHYLFSGLDLVTCEHLLTSHVDEDGYTPLESWSLKHQAGTATQIADELGFKWFSKLTQKEPTLLEQFYNLQGAALLEHRKSLVNFLCDINFHIKHPFSIDVSYILLTYAGFIHPSISYNEFKKIAHTLVENGNMLKDKEQKISALDCTSTSSLAFYYAHSKKAILYKNIEQPLQQARQLLAEELTKVMTPRQAFKLLTWADKKMMANVSREGIFGGSYMDSVVLFNHKGNIQQGLQLLCDWNNAKAVAIDDLPEVIAGEKIEVKDDLGRTPAYHAAKKGELDTLKTLHAQHKPLNQPAFLGTTPLQIAAVKGHVPCVVFLMMQLSNTTPVSSLTRQAIIALKPQIREYLKNKDKAMIKEALEANTLMTYFINLQTGFTKKDQSKTKTELEHVLKSPST